MGLPWQPLGVPLALTQIGQLTGQLPASAQAHSRKLKQEFQSLVSCVLGAA